MGKEREKRELRFIADIYPFLCGVSFRPTHILMHQIGVYSFTCKEADRVIK